MKPFALLPLLFLFASFSASAAGSAALRIVCDGDAEGAEVYVNGKFKGECPLDMKVPEGKLKLRVQKAVDAVHEPRLFEQEIRLGDGVVKTVEVQLGAAELNAAGEKVIKSIEAEMVAIPGKNYAMGKYEITQNQWKAIMGSYQNYFARIRNIKEECGDCPTGVASRDDAMEFIQKLNQRTGKQYRLPTENEWKDACYGGSQTKYCGSDSADAVAWHQGNSGDKTHPVGQKQPNAFGLYDMSGNVWEWVSSERGTLLGGSSKVGPDSVRDNVSPSLVLPPHWSGGSGFRLVMTLP